MGPGSVRLIPAAVLRGEVTVRWRARREAELPRTQPVWLDHGVGQSVWGAQGLACHLLLRTGLSGSTSRARRFFLLEQVKCQAVGHEDSSLVQIISMTV